MTEGVISTRNLRFHPPDANEVKVYFEIETASRLRLFLANTDLLR